MCAKAIYKVPAKTSETKGHYLNVVVGKCKEMIEKNYIC